MMPSFYNNNYQIVQNAGYVVILVEMIHDARIIPIDNRPASSRQRAAVAGKRRGSLGRQHARRRDNELHGQDELSKHQSRT